MFISLASQTLRREEGSGHVATLKLSPRQKLDVTNQIGALHSSHVCHVVQLHHNVLNRCQHFII